MKKIDKLILTSFLGPFILTFLVVVFILLNIHMLKYFDDIIGKDLGWDVIGKLLFYFAVFNTPVALPLAVLLSSLITFGNLGEHFELTPEIMFVQKGASVKTVNFQPEDKAIEGTYDYFYNTFETGLLAGYKPVATLPISVQAGAFLGSHFHNLDRKQRDLYVGDYENINNAIQAVDLNEAFTGIDFGPVVGISAGAGRFRVNARYYLGTRNLNNNRDFVAKTNYIRTNSMRLTLTYFFKQ